MIARLVLSLILFIAGIVHIVRPDFFDPAIPFPLKYEINCLAGIIEMALATSFWIPRFRDLGARLCALWFLILIPIHVYICVMEIPIFGISNPAFLWGRTLFQPVLYFWALSLQEEGWIMSQRWSDVVFLHYEVDQKKLQELVPFPLDLFEGKAIVSIVPFVMSRIRFPFLPPIPGFSKLLELNLRTYVTVDHKRAVYFFTLDSNHLPGVLIARWFFALPYRWAKLKIKVKNDYEFSSANFEIKARPQSIKVASAFDRWATERYALFTHRGTKNFCGIVEHKSWDLQDLEIVSLRDDFSSMLGTDLKAKSFRASAYAKVLDVRFRPFRKMASSSSVL